MLYPLILKIMDPSGETRRIPLSNQSTFRLGRDPDADILVRDPTLPEQIGQLRFSPKAAGIGEKPWLILDPHCPHAELACMPFREAAIPIGTPVRIGETTFSLEVNEEARRLPDAPKGTLAWRTQSESGGKLLWMTKKAAGTPLSIYIAGETGTGKEVIAGLVHGWSERARGPFVPLHCGALAPSLAESELFGHVKGAFTGANGARVGALLQAHGGTLFLDEVGDLSLDLQVKLLRFLENGEVRPVGSDQIRHASVRVVCATHLPLRKLVEEGKFRRDLYYRLASVTLEIPTLRARPEDISDLAVDYAAQLGKIIAPRTLLRLQAYAWPGNVRELRHAVERAAGLSGPFTSVLDDEAFTFLFTQAGEDSAESYVAAELAGGMLSLEEMERVMMLRSLKLTGGNRAEAAKILGVARSTFFEMLKRHRIEGPRAALYQRPLETRAVS
ncbi:MAG: sigma-54-dependent Fis family transcriptional regulator [Cryobacterium sp.]|nr:sigma-54-dependent Fis family transcriptional regulator [Oligoflexia bacterium]